MSPYYVSLAFLAGALLPLAVGINTSLSKLLGSSAGAASINFTVGAIALIGYLIVSGFVFSKAGVPSVSILRSVPFWTITGGIFGAIYVATTILCAPELGCTLLVVLIVAGQMICSLIFDHYGWIGFPVHPINIWRVIGVGLLLMGVLIILKN